MTPYEIDIMIYYYCRVDDHPDIDRDPPIYQPTMAMFERDGLLETNPSKETDDDPQWRITPRGRAYVDALQAVPMPEQIWIVNWPTRTDAP